MRYVTAGESHGNALTAIVTGVPAGLTLTEEAINADLGRRSSGFGRSVRQRLEGDEVVITGGVRFGRTTGAPVSLMIRNAAEAVDEAGMAAAGNPPAGYERSFVPRPGHADLAGVQKYGFGECRDVAERASARETAARVAAAGVAWEFLAELDVDLFSFVCGVGGVELPVNVNDVLSFGKLAIETSELRCPDEAVTAAMMERIREAAKAGTSVGGIFCVVASGLVPGLGGYASGADRLTSRLGAAVLSVPSVKGIEFGLGFETARRDGRDALDEIRLTAAGFSRATNYAGGLEGGMTTGEPLILRAAVKPIPTQAEPLASVNLDTLKAAKAPAPRADVCAVPAAAVVAEAEVAFVLAQAYLDKFGGDAMADIKTAVRQYRQRLRLMTR